MRSSDRGPAPDRPGRARHAAACVLLAAVVGGAALSLFDRSLLRSPERASVLDGSWTTAWQAAYEQALPVRDGAIALWTLLRFELFREARPEVLIGSDGWLYSAEEFDPPAALSVPLGSAVQRIASIRDALTAKGIDLVVALVPTKASVQGSHLGRYTIPPLLASRYAAALSALRGRGVTAPDLLAGLRVGATATDMYLRTDTHWTPQGARRAAQTLAPVIIPLLAAHSSPRQPFLSEPGPRSEVSGDLLKFVPLGPWHGLGPAPDIVEETITSPAVGGEEPGSPTPEELFGELDIPVALVGTSYSVNPVSGFEGALKDAVDADVLNVAAEGKGPFAPMDAYLGSSAMDDPRPDVVVWEIPERYLAPDPG